MERREKLTFTLFSEMEALTSPWAPRYYNTNTIQWLFDVTFAQKTENLRKVNFNWFAMILMQKLEIEDFFWKSYYFFIPQGGITLKRI